jgi:hypothetical protein
MEEDIMMPYVLTEGSATTDTMPHAIAVDPGFQWRQASGAVPFWGPWHLRAIEEVYRAAIVPSDWDSYGSPPPSTHVRDRSLSLLQYLVGAGFDLSLPVPYAVPVAGGGIRLEWENSGREVAIEVTPGGTMEYFRVQDGEPEDEGQLLRDQLPALLDWLTAAVRS